MAQSKKPKKTKREEPELEPDAWDRFKDTMDKIVPPKRKPKKDEGSSDG